MDTLLFPVSRRKRKWENMGSQNMGHHPENQRLVIYSSTPGGDAGRGGNSKIAGAAMERLQKASGSDSRDG